MHWFTIPNNDENGSTVLLWFSNGELSVDIASRIVQLVRRLITQRCPNSAGNSIQQEKKSLLNQKIDFTENSRDQGTVFFEEYRYFFDKSHDASVFFAIQSSYRSDLKFWTIHCSKGTKCN